MDKQVKINYLNVFNHYQQCQKQNKQEKQETQVSINTPSSNSKFLNNTATPHRNHQNQIRSFSEHKISNINSEQTLENAKQQSVNQRKFKILISPRDFSEKTISSARNTSATTRHTQKTLSKDKNYDASPNNQQYQETDRVKPISIISQNFQNSQRTGSQTSRNKQKNPNISIQKQQKLNQENILVSKITHLLKKHKNKEEKNDLKQIPFLNQTLGNFTQRGKQIKDTMNLPQFSLQDQILKEQQFSSKRLIEGIGNQQTQNQYNQSENKQKDQQVKFEQQIIKQSQWPQYEQKQSLHNIQNQNEQKQISWKKILQKSSKQSCSQRLTRCISIQTDKLATARNLSSLQHFDISPIRQINKSLNESQLNDSKIFKYEEEAINSQQIIFDEQVDKQQQSQFMRRQLSLHSAKIRTNSCQNALDKKFLEMLRGKSTENSSPSHAAVINESNQFKIKLLQNFKDQVENKTDLSKKYFNPLKLSKQEKRISQMIAAKLVPNTISSKNIEQLYNTRQQQLSNSPWSLQLYLESQLPYQSILERQQKEKCVEISFRKTLNRISKINQSQSQNQSLSNICSPCKQSSADKTFNEKTPLSSFHNIDSKQQSPLLKKTSLIIQAPSSPKKEFRFNLDFNKSQQCSDIVNEVLNTEENPQSDDKRSISYQTSFSKDFTPCRSQKSFSTFSKNVYPFNSRNKDGPLSSRIQESGPLSARTHDGYPLSARSIDYYQKKESESLSPNKIQKIQLHNYIPSQLEKKQGDIIHKINKIQYKSLLKISKKVNFGNFKSLKDQNTNAIIHQSMKKFLPIQQSNDQNQIFRFETHQSEQGNEYSECNKEDNSLKSPISQLK